MPLQTEKNGRELRSAALLLLLILMVGTFLCAFLLPLLSDSLPEGTAAAVLYYLTSLLSVAVLFSGAAGTVFGLVNARFSFAVFSSAALFLCLLSAELLPILIAPITHTDASLGEIFSANADAFFTRAAFDFLRIVLIWAGAFAGIAIAARAKEKQKKRAFFLVALFTAALLCLLPALTELFETAIPFLSAASRNQKNAELPKILLEYFLYLLYGAIGFFVERAVCRLLARLSAPRAQKRGGAR